MKNAEQGAQGTTNITAALDDLVQRVVEKRRGLYLAISDQLDIPVKFIGLGEKPEDIAEFDPSTFVEALFD